MSAVRPAPLFSTRFPLAALALLPMTGPASAQDDGWHWDLTPYAWATDVGIDTQLGGRQVVDATIPVEDLIDDIDLTFQGRVEAQHGEHGVLLDLFYVSMSDEVNTFQLPQGAGTGDLDWKLDMSVADVAGIYDPKGDRRGFSFLYGARIIDQRVEVDANFQTTSGNSSEHYEASDTLVDALVGVRFRGELTEHLTLSTQLDASAGGTDHTWSAFPSLTWSFGDGRYALMAGYRHMSVDFASEGDLDTDMSLSGPLVGLRMSL